MTPEELSDADRDINAQSYRREAAKTTLLTSIQAFLRLFLVAAVVALVGDWFLSRTIRHTLVSDNIRTVAWIEDHKKDFLKLLVAAAQHNTQESADRATDADTRAALHDLQTRMRRVESATSVIQSTSHNHNGNGK